MYLLQVNKAGYTAITSWGRLGRGGNARFHTYQIVFMDRLPDQPTNGRTDKAAYRVACPQLKTNQIQYTQRTVY